MPEFQVGEERTLVITIGGASDPITVDLRLTITAPSGRQVTLDQQVLVQPGGTTATFTFIPTEPGPHHWVLIGTAAGVSPFRIEGDLLIAGDPIAPAPVGLVAGVLAVLGAIALIATKKV